MWATNTPHASSLILKMYLVAMVTASAYQHCRKKLNWSAGTLITQVFFYTMPGERRCRAKRDLTRKIPGECTHADWLVSIWNNLWLFTHTVAALQHSIHNNLYIFQHLYFINGLCYGALFTIITSFLHLPPRHWRKRQLPTPHGPVDQVSLVTQESDLNVQDRSVTLRNSALREPFDSPKK